MSEIGYPEGGNDKSTGDLSRPTVIGTSQPVSTDKQQDGDTLEKQEIAKRESLFRSCKRIEDEELMTFAKRLEDTHCIAKQEVQVEEGKKNEAKNKVEEAKKKVKEARGKIEASENNVEEAERNHRKANKRSRALLEELEEEQRNSKNLEYKYNTARRHWEAVSQKSEQNSEKHSLAWKLLTADITLFWLAVTFLWLVVSITLLQQPEKWDFKQELKSQFARFEEYGQYEDLKKRADDLKKIHTEITRIWEKFETEGKIRNKVQDNVDTAKAKDARDKIEKVNDGFKRLLDKVVEEIHNLERFQKDRENAQKKYLRAVGVISIDNAKDDLKTTEQNCEKARKAFKELLAKLIEEIPTLEHLQKGHIKACKEYWDTVSVDNAKDAVENAKAEVKRAEQDYEESNKRFKESLSKLEEATHNLERLQEERGKALDVCSDIVGPKFNRDFEKSSQVWLILQVVFAITWLVVMFLWLYRWPFESHDEKKHLLGEVNEALKAVTDAQRKYETVQGRVNVLNRDCAVASSNVGEEENKVIKRKDELKADEEKAKTEKCDLRKLEVKYDECEMRWKMAGDRFKKFFKEHDRDCEQLKAFIDIIQSSTRDGKPCPPFLFEKVCPPILLSPLGRPDVLGQHVLPSAVGEVTRFGDVTETIELQSLWREERWKISEDQTKKDEWNIIDAKTDSKPIPIIRIRRANNNKIQIEWTEEAIKNFDPSFNDVRFSVLIVKNTVMAVKDGTEEISWRHYHPLFDAANNIVKKSLET